MKKSNAVIATVLALLIGYAAGYYSHIVRFPMRHRHPELFANPASAKPPPMSHPIAAEVEKARKLLAAGKRIEAQQLLRDQVRMFPQAPEAREARELLGALNTELFFSRDDLFGKTEYVVERGDTLARIASRLDSSPEMIMRANALPSTLIRTGDRLLVPDGDFTMTIDLPKQRVVVHHGDGFFKQYPIQSINLPLSSQPRLSTQVTATTMWKDGERISSGLTDLDEATPWVHLARPGYILYGVSEEAGVEPGAIGIAERESAPAKGAAPSAERDPDIPTRGIALLKDDLAEMQLLLSRGTPVTIIRERK